MPSVKRKHEYEKFESLFRRFKKEVDANDTMKEVRERQAYEKPSLKRKRARAAAIKRAQKRDEENVFNKKRLF